MQASHWRASRAFVAAGAARAEHLIVSVSNHRVTVTPNYSGEELVLFGSIEHDATTPVSRGSYDIVVTVAGPRTTMVTRRKERVFGIWVNANSREFLNVPSYLAVFSNQPLYAIAAPEILRRQQLGIDNVILTQRVGSDFADVVADDPFRPCLRAVAQKDHGLYRKSANAVTFLTANLFRTGIPLPAEVPIGTYYGRHQGARQRRADRAHGDCVRGRQGRLRAIRRQRLRRTRQPAI